MAVRIVAGTLILLACLIAASAVRAKVAEGEGVEIVAPAGAPGAPVVVFATEKSAGRWGPSAFNGLLAGDLQQNGCEGAAGEALRSAGFALPGSVVSTEQRREARVLATVFERYSDASTIPNDILSRAAAIVESSAGAVVACGVVVNPPKADGGKAFGFCATAHCKAIETQGRQRLATASGVRCTPEGGPAAIREVCGEMGARLAGKIAGR
jgi:hypothetical protein